MFHLKFGSSKKFIVFLHGWGADHKSFLWLKDYFDEYSLLFVDFPGFGNSEEPSIGYHVSDYANELMCVLDEYEIEELLIVGHSFGGRVAIKFAFLFQNEFDRFRLCLVDSAGILPKRTLKYYLNVLAYKRCKRKAVKSQKHREKLKTFGSSDYKCLSQNMKKVFVNVVNEDLSSFAKNIKCDTLLIWGEKDKDTKLYMAKKLHRLIEKSDLYILKNAGHFSFLDRQNEFLFLLDRFVKN